MRVFSRGGQAGLRPEPTGSESTPGRDTGRDHDYTLARKCELLGSFLAGQVKESALTVPSPSGERPQETRGLSSSSEPGSRRLLPPHCIRSLRNAQETVCWGCYSRGGGRWGRGTGRAPPGVEAPAALKQTGSLVICSLGSCLTCFVSEVFKLSVAAGSFFT